MCYVLYIYNTYLLRKQINSSFGFVKASTKKMNKFDRNPSKVFETLKKC